MRKPLVAGNWKMNGRRDSIEGLVHAIIDDFEVANRVEVVVCPPAIYIPLVCELVKSQKIAVGAQNLSEHGDGAYTGELSGEMLRDNGCQFVIAGHSERRSLFAETDEQVAKKIEIALTAGLTPILCVGEALPDKKSGKTLSVVSRQLRAVIDVIGSRIGEVVVAYEPVWAIGTGLTATPEQAQEIHLAIREQIRVMNDSAADSVRILYGGSVKAENARELFGQPDIDGGLIGGASLKASEFVEICVAAT